MKKISFVLFFFILFCQLELVSSNCSDLFFSEAFSSPAQEARSKGDYCVRGFQCVLGGASSCCYSRLACLHCANPNNVPTCMAVTTGSVAGCGAVVMGAMALIHTCCPIYRFMRDRGYSIGAVERMVKFKTPPGGRSVALLPVVSPAKK